MDGFAQIRMDNVQTKDSYEYSRNRKACKNKTRTKASTQGRSNQRPAKQIQTNGGKRPISNAGPTRKFPNASSHANVTKLQLPSYHFLSSFFLLNVIKLKLPSSSFYSKVEIESLSWGHAGVKFHWWLWSSPKRTRTTPSTRFLPARWQ